MASSRWGLGLCLAFIACQPLYGGKADRLKNPEPHKRPDNVAGAEPTKYIEECNADFKEDPKGKKPQPQVARPLFEVAETDMTTAEREKDDNKKVGLIKDAIDKYRNALIKDPWNVEITLKLAVAYDKAHRKGCAIAMLKRLAALSANTRMAPEANRNIDSIDVNGQWFKDYRKDAMTAVGR
jgi:hypothetical protein